MTRRLPVVAGALLAVLALAGGCTRTIPGQALGGLDPASAGGLPVTDGPSGPRPGAPDAELPVQGSDRGEIDTLGHQRGGRHPGVLAGAVPA